MASDIVGAHGADPLHPGPTTGVLNGLPAVTFGLVRIQGSRDQIGLNQRRNVLPTGCRRVAVVDNDLKGRRAY